jgi:hypothetical protein
MFMFDVLIAIPRDLFLVVVVVLVVEVVVVGGGGGGGVFGDIHQQRCSP